MTLDELLGGRSDGAVCRAAGMAPGTLRRYRRGIGCPRHDVVVRLAVTLGLDLATVGDAVAETVARARAARQANT
jgi:hypothetical protein